ncbi:MAG: GrpB family protein [Proteobacteria bacterium]|nr:GrpB family protein [Pseudomonadota bacterium]
MIHNIADYEVIAFEPSRFHPDFATFILEPEKENIELVPYTPEWEVTFKAEAEKISHALGQTLLDIHHIGSTAIPGIVAKPIVDILPVVKDIQEVDRLTSSLEALGYEAKGEYGMPGRRFFIKKQKGKRLFNVHIFEEGHADIERHLRFRDYMRDHPDTAQVYSDLKKDLVKKSPDDIEKYCWGKEDFIKGVELKALLWKTH